MAIPGDLADVWETYGQALDTDTARLAYDQAVRFAIAALCHRDKGVQAMLDQVLEVLDTLKLS